MQPHLSTARSPALLCLALPHPADDNALQLAIRSCRACMLLQTRSLFLKKAVSMSAKAGHFATANAVMYNGGTGAPAPPCTRRLARACLALAWV
jgi:hypothetical protein